MDFLKELFNGGALTFDQLSAAVKEKGFSVVNAAGGAYIPKADADNLHGQITTLTGQLGDANKKLEGYDPDWRNKAENDRKALEKQQFDFATRIQRLHYRLPQLVSRDIECYGCSLDKWIYRGLQQQNKGAQAHLLWCEKL